MKYLNKWCLAVGLFCVLAFEVNGGSAATESTTVEGPTGLKDRQILP
jgi:hypothetical protein